MFGESSILILIYYDLQVFKGALLKSLKMVPAISLSDSNGFWVFQSICLSKFNILTKIDVNYFMI